MSEEENVAFLNKYRDSFHQYQAQEMSLNEYLEGCKSDPSFYASPQERMLRAIGEPKIIDTREDERLGRIFENRKIQTFPTFQEKFFGIEPVIEQLYLFFKKAGLGLEERKQILYFLGPVGGGKSSLAEMLKILMEKEPFYAIRCGEEISPVFESPLGLFSPGYQRKSFSNEFNIPDHKIPRVMSPWAAKRIKENNGDLSCFNVVKLYPSILDQVAIAVVDPADENSQDVSTLVGKTDIRKLEEFSQDDPDSYSYSGGLCRGNQGFLEFREMFKAPIKTLNPLLFATQDGCFKSTEGLSAIPFQGIVLAHSNEAEWNQFRADKKNEAFLDRVCLVKVPYVMRKKEEAQIYHKLLEESDLREAPIAPGTLDLLAQFAVLSRISEHQDSSWMSKVNVYNGESIRGTDPKEKTIQEYRSVAGVNEGMTGISTRFMFKVLSSTFNFDPDEVAANPVHMLSVLEEAIRQKQFGDDKEKLYIDEFLKGILIEDLKKHIKAVLQEGYIESYTDYGQNLFNDYIKWADVWLEGNEYRDPDTQTTLSREELDQKLSEKEKAAGIANPKDFRSEVVRWCHKYEAEHHEFPRWDSYEKIREVLDNFIMAGAGDMFKVIVFGNKESEKIQKKHDDFVDRMKKLGYTLKQIQVLVEWHERVRKNS